MHPNILLMDEPFSALDVLTAETLRGDFLDLWGEGQMPIKAVLLVTNFLTWKRDRAGRMVPHWLTRLFEQPWQKLGFVARI